MKKIFYYAITWLFIFIIVSLAWVGAEWVFEGAVHSSQVDGTIAGVLTYCLTERTIRK